MKIDRIEELNMHDSVITDIAISRNGERTDTVDIFLDYIDDYEKMCVSSKILRFNECYKLAAEMNFGVSSPESILKAETINPSELAETVKNEHEKMPGNQLKFPLKHYRIETNTTASVIDVVARSLELIDRIIDPG